MTEPSRIWVVRTSMRDLHGWYYVGVETESEAHRTRREETTGRDIYRRETYKKRRTREGTRIASGSNRRLLGTLNPRISRNGSRRASLTDTAQLAQRDAQRTHPRLSDAART